ncbi:hypothetical protein AOG55_08460 [Acidiplasma cupricumulans]|jgi:NADH dehydrogenase|uniref:NADH:ubiquinone reductase (non-electrogenic) n=2 Tax=Acidiplasma TaxID=507753 RepID=A0A0Q0VTP6_9ARCH|nr:hypothetical protein AOG55_08460 [Acidiplasma cupricumulans]
MLSDLPFMEKIVIIGGGIAGVAAKTYNRDAMLVEKSELMTVFPRLIDVASGMDQKFAVIKRNADVYDEVMDIDFKNRKVITKKRKIGYDKLIVALGKSQNYSFLKGKQYIYPMAQLSDAIKLRDSIKNAKNLTIIGGGYLGVELAGSLHGVNIKIIEAGKRLLQGLKNEYHEIALKKLSELGVDVLFNTKVIEVKKDSIITDAGDFKSDVSVFAGGLTGNLLLNDLDITTLNSKIVVDSYLRSVDYDDVYACGDSMAIKNTFTPMSAIIARSSGIRAMANAMGEDLEYKPNNFANIIRVGNYYFGDFFNYRVNGFIARIIKESGIAISINYAKML